MIRLRKFDFLTPKSLEEAKNSLSDINGEVKIMAGGTNLLVRMKQDVIHPKRVIWLGRVRELRQMTFSREEGLQIGAMCTLREIEVNEEVQLYYPSIMQAVRSIASLQIRNTATIGGNLCLDTQCFYFDQSEFWRRSLGYCLKLGDGVCHAAPQLHNCPAVFCSDLAPLLIALDAKVILCGLDSERKFHLKQFYCNDGAKHLTLKPSEFLSRIIVPYDPSINAIHLKLRNRNSFDFPLVNVGIALSLSENSRCTRARIVVGALTSAPVDTVEAAAKLVGGEVNEDSIDVVAKMVSATIHPMPNVDGSVSYRKKMVGVLVQRALREVALPQ